MLSDVDWDGHWVCEQQITHVLSKTNKVIYVEQIRTLLAFFNESGWDITPLRKIALIRKRVRQLTSNLFVISPPLLLPFRYLPIVRQINQRFLVYWLKGLLRRNEAKDGILITFDPDTAGVVGHLGERLSLYYRNDNHDKSGIWFNPDRLVSLRESALMRKVDLVCALSNGLAAKSRKLNVRTEVIPNGVNTDMFSDVLRLTIDEPADISGIPRPRIGTIGMLDWRTDVALLENLALNRRDWSIVLIGPVNGPDKLLFDNLRQLKNVFFLGRKKVSDVPIYIKSLDIGLIPYKIDDYTKGILSLKIFEYSAMGVPSIATPMPELFPYSEYIDFATNASDFQSRISATLKTHSEFQRKRLQEFALRNSWQQRAEHLSCVIQNGIDNRQLS